MQTTHETLFFRRNPQTRRLSELLANPANRGLGSTSEQCAVHLALGQAHLSPPPYNTEATAWGRLDDDQREFVNIVRTQNGLEAL